MALLLNAGIIVKLVLILLLFFSVVSWTIILFKLFQVQRANSGSERFMVLFWKSARFDSIASQVDRFTGCPLAVLFNEAYAELNKLMNKGSQNGAGLSTDPGRVENVSFHRPGGSHPRSHGLQQLPAQDPRSDQQDGQPLHP